MPSLPRRLRLGIELRHAGPEGSAFCRGGVAAARVSPGSMAEAAGMQAGDRLTSLDALPVRTRAELQVALRSAGPGGSVKLSFDRGGEAVSKSVPAVRAAAEEGVLYDVIEREGVRLRTMVAPAPGPGRRPAIVFLQGLSRATMDFAFQDLLRGWRNGGFVTMRVERRGVGDSEGEAPELGDFPTEVADVRAAIHAVSRYEFVDPEAIFVFGHSVGGMIAPKLEAEDLLRGYLIYGSTADPWFDCLEASARRQCGLRGRGDVEACVTAHREEMRTHPVIDGRSALYHRQLHDAGIAAAWSRARRPVLVLHGAHDWVVSEEEARRIAQLSRGTFRQLPRLDHLLSAHDSVEESLRGYGKGRFDPQIVHETCAWIRGATGGGSA